MNKDTYETYEFLPANNGEAESDQFLVVQDDGTFLLNRQIQYVAQVQDVKEVLEDVQPCAVYGVSSQQFFVDVDNSAELISVSDQFILPEGDNGLYTNSYLLQPSSSTTTEQMEDVVVDQFKQPDTQDVDIDVAHDSKQANNFTEITLSDEQYQTLEQKGWILLESNDKIFVLNTLGLHDITTNDKLIQKLKNELQNDTTDTGNDDGNFKMESVSNEFPNIVTEPLSNQQNTVEFVISTENEQIEPVENVFIVNKKEDIQGSISADDNMVVSSETQKLPIEYKFPEIPKQETYYDKDTRSIKIKTKFKFNDIPDKIFLGKSANGKKLVAKVIKSEPIKKDGNKYETTEVNPVIAEVPSNQHYNMTGLHETRFVGLVQAMLRSRGPSRTSAQDIASANNVLPQLLKVPNLKETLVGHNLIVTKATQNKDEFGTINNKSRVTMITGQVKESEETYSFEHMPNLLQDIKLHAEEQNITQSDEVYSSLEEKEAKENFTIFHVHITETKCHDNVVRVSVTLNKRQLPVNLVFDLKKRYPSTVFGCSGCAGLFKSEKALKEHQENQCMDTDDMLTIDSDHSNNEDDVIVMKNGNQTQFSCGQCNTTFTRLNNMHRHMKTHHGMSQQTDGDIDNKTIMKKKHKIFKCKMCPSTYFHSASLSKHIVNRHIKMKSN